jgi:hypothetical protein
MADIPASASELLMTSHVQGALQTASDSRNNASLFSQTLAAGAVATQNLLGTTIAGRTVSGVNATPLAGPVDKVA